ncbi:MAG TPA: DUF2007 domain-containing protein [Longimicrobiales bacterium]
MTREPAWVTVATYAAVYQAEMAVGILEDAGIPAVTRGEQTGIFGPGWAGTVAKGVDVLVPDDCAEAARLLLARE